MSRAIRADRRTNFLLPPAIEEWIPKDDPVRFVEDVVEQMDLRSMGFVNPDPSDPGAPAYSEELLLAVWLYGYMRRIRSTRKLEEACRERMQLLWLTGMQYPDHNTLWRFFREHRDDIRKVFRNLLVAAHRAGLVGMVAHALDGTKLQAACSNDTALHGPALTERLAELTKAIEEIEKQIGDTEASETGEQRLSEQLTDAKTRRDSIKESLALLAENSTEHLHPTEPDATVVGIRGGGKKLGYNAQAVADENHLIVAEQVEAEPTDQGLLAPMLDRAAETLGERPEQTLVDQGYVSATNVAKAHEHDHSIVIPEAAFVYSQHDPNNPFDKAYFTYDAERDVYICPQNQLLPPYRLVASGRGLATKAVYRCETKDCPVREQCSKDKSGRTIRRSPDDHAMLRQRELQKRDEDSARLYARRKTIIEVVFAVLKEIDGFRRFTMRGLKSVQAQWSLLCTAYNLRKLVRHWREGRFDPATAFA